MLMRKTKLYPVKDRGNNYGLWVEENGKYKLIFKHPKISVVKRKRAEVQSESINVKAVLAKKTFVEVYAEFAAYKLDEANDSKHGKTNTRVEFYLNSIINKEDYGKFK